jgi:RNA polymerase sigma factor (sigma-70 family)
LFKKISDINIICGVRDQDDNMLNWLYDNYFQVVKNHVIGNSGSNEDVYDVFQDSIIVLYNQIMKDELHLTTDLKGYFFGIARNVWSTQLRKKRKTIELEEDLPNEEKTDEDNELILEKIISRAFQKLKPDQKLILNLFSDGLSFEEIAVKMDLKNGTYARRKKYLSKEALLDIAKEDPEYQEYFRFQ